MILLIVALIGKNIICKIVLPQIAIGNYWLTDGSEKERKLINIEGVNGEWFVSSNNSIQLIEKEAARPVGKEFKVDYTRKLDKVSLSNYDTYIVQFVGSNELFVLCCFPACDSSLFRLELKNGNEILIGKSQDNGIVYDNEFVADIHAKMNFSNGNFFIENHDVNFGTFVNNKPVFSGGTWLQNGDIVFIMGLKIIIMGKSIFINSPNNKVLCTNNLFSLVESKVEIENNDETEEYIELYSEDEYFSRVPRITNIIERERVKIDAPPHIQDQQEMPLILVLGSSLSMGTMMIVSIINTIDGKLSGNANAKQTTFALVTAVAMLISMLVFPFLSVRYDRKKKKKYEEKRQSKYKDYLNSKNDLIGRIMENHKSIMYENYLPAAECVKIILDKSPRLWERKIEDYDFLKIRLGIGDIPSEIDIQYPEEKFEMDDDNLVEILNAIGNNSKTL